MSPARALWCSLALALSSLGPSVALGQVRHRRPMSPSPNVNYGFDNNSGSGCRDYNCGSRCYDGHSGTDFGIPVGTTVVAGADGVVVATHNGCANYGYVGNPCGGRCGNYVQLQHSDGSRSIYCHMQLNSLAVSRGQRVRCGQTLGRSASSGSSSGPHLHFGWKRSASGASIDSYRGRCTSSPGAWTDQRSYPQSPGANCACVATTETCNNRDDDCDGRVDDGVTRGCYTGPSGTAGRGICRQGTETCASGRWGSCAGQVLPRTETCNRLDDDCDGRVDDGVCTPDAGPPRDASLDARADVRTDVLNDVRSDALNDVRSDVLNDVRSDARADVPSDLPGEPLEDAGVDLPPTEDVTPEDAASEDTGAEDTSAEDDDAGFEDVGPEQDAEDVSPDREDPPDGCGCRAVGASRTEGAWTLALASLAVAWARRRRPRRG